jgi:N-acetylglucosaminyldiphosphoundecaprenol N-acetyl-beta-D-mannosaminyltransferase
VKHRANVLGVGIDPVNLTLAADMIDRAAAGDTKDYVCVTGVHGVMEAQHDPGFKTILDRAMLVVPDGVPTVWLGRMQGHADMSRVFGPDLMTEVCRRSPLTGRTHFLYGGKPGVAEELKRNLESRYPGIRIVGTYCPPFRALTVDERKALNEVLTNVKPDILWVGLSTPKQERFMAENVGLLNCKIMIGVGAAFDLHTGRMKDAPQWIKDAGMQWLHRLCQEPGRLWKRYLVNNSGFLVRVALQFAGLKRYQLSQQEVTTE